MRPNRIIPNRLNLAKIEVTVFKPHGEPPEGALIDADGMFIVDKRGKYIVTTETN